MTVLSINPLAVIVAVVVMQALGTLWYGPVFGKMWQGAMGKTMAEMGNPTQSIIISTVAALVTAIGMAMIVSAASMQNVVAGITLGAIVGVAFASAPHVTNTAYEGRNWTVATLFIGYQIVGSVLMGAIIGYWQ